MKQYKELLQKILDEGNDKSDRTGTGTVSYFGAEMRFDLSKGFPLLTTKKVFLKGIIHELLWMISGDTNIKYLNDNGVHIWDEWADTNGDLGPIYGKQWRRVESRMKSEMGFDITAEIDQLGGVIERIKSNPDDRRLIVSAWNVAELHEMKLPPCHAFFQFYVADGKLSLKITQRSADMFLGVPFNIASYALLTMMVAHVCDLELGDLIWSGGDCHIYYNHLEQVQELLSRRVRKLPKMEIVRKVKSIDDFVYEDFKLTGYNPHPAIKAPVAV